jgi:hypothetical protein
MSSIIDGFDASSIPESQPMEAGPLPEGDYQVSIVDAEEKQNKAVTGSYLELTFEVVGNSHKGRRIWARLNLDNPSEKAVEIARRDLAAICRAVNLLRPKSIVQFIGKELWVSVRHKPGRGDYGPSAEIFRYLPASDKAPAPAAKPEPKRSLLESLPDDLPF